MASIFNTLNIGYTGLSTAQIGVDTTGHNISNAETEGYTRQRVVQSAATPISSRPGQVGNGVEVTDIKRVFDNYVFDRYTAISSDKENIDYQEKTLNELSSYFPEIDGVGIKADLASYYDMWQTLSDNPDNDAIKVLLAKQTQSLTEHITNTQNQILSLQSQVNDELVTNINEVNSLAKELSLLNTSIDTAESGDLYSANDLRDRRNVIERSLSRLIGSTVKQGQLASNIQIDSSSNTRTGSYTISVNGFNIVDGSTYHPIVAQKDDNPYGFYKISYERQDGVKIPMEETINGGKIGAILSLRGRAIDSTSNMPVDGTLQNSVSQLDAFATTLIESTNNLYASSATTRMDSNILSVSDIDPIVSSSLNIQTGSFDMVLYDVDGNEAARRTIMIDDSTSLAGSGSNSIKSQMQAQKDDNDDSDATNDIDDYVNFNWATYSSGGNAVEFTLDPKAESDGYTFAIEDNLSDNTFNSGSNFAGALGLGRYFDGTNARDIKLHDTFLRNPTKISAGESSTSGDNQVGIKMVQHQFEEYHFTVGQKDYDSTSYEMFDTIATEVGSATNAAIIKAETISTQFNAVELEYSATSKVSVDEEMTNLIKYQTSYGAAAKVITTIDQMLQTLLGIKQ